MIKTNKNKQMNSKCWSIPDKFDCNHITLDPNIMFICYVMCKISVKVKTIRAYIFSRWNEHLVSKGYQTKHGYRRHIRTMQLKISNDVVLSKGYSAVLRKQVGILSFSIKKKEKTKLLIKSILFYKIQLSANAYTDIISSTKRIGIIYQ